MNILGHGIDFVEIERIAQMASRYGPRFLDRCFTQAEQRYCRAHPKRCYEHYAGRFAAKEAALKALGTGWRDGIAWTDVEVVRKPSGEPVLKVTGHAERLAQQKGITQWQVSVSHTAEHAVASVIAAGRQNP